MHAEVYKTCTRLVRENMPRNGCRSGGPTVDADSVHVAGGEADKADEGDGLRRDGHQRRGTDIVVVVVNEAAAKAGTVTGVTCGQHGQRKNRDADDIAVSSWRRSHCRCLAASVGTCRQKGQERCR